MERKHLALVAILNAVICISVRAQQIGSADQSKEVVLVCPVKSTSGEMAFDLSLRVSYSAATVNDLPAQISEAEIRWEQCGSDSYCNFYILNRYTGSLTFGSKAFPALFKGQCSRPTDKKF